MKRLVIVGAGSFAREVAWLVEEINKVEPEWEFLGFVDDSVTGETIEGYKVLCSVKELGRLSPRPMLVCAIGNPTTRKKIVEPLEEQGYQFATLVHPSVIMSRYVQIGHGSIICAGTILTTNIHIGKHCILNLNCKVGHDTRLGDYASLMPATNLAGNVTVGEGCYFGLNSAAINDLSIGEWSVIGAGAVVVKDIPLRVVAVGVPARPIRDNLES